MQGEQFQFLPLQFFYQFYLSQIIHIKRHKVVLNMDQLFSFISPGKKPNFSPASTAGLDKITLSTFFPLIEIPQLKLLKNFPVPAGPSEITISFSFSALI